MEHYLIDGIDVISQNVSEDELKAYTKRAPKGTYTMIVKPDGAFVDIKYKYKTKQPFERIRRITGYLVGTLDRWNDAKRAEESDRVKHTV